VIVNQSQDDTETPPAKRTKVDKASNDDASDGNNALVAVPLSLEKPSVVDEVMGELLPYTFLLCVSN